jgi:3-phenylpropionate/cinnamic acid dioxygenase small subunit
MTSEAAVKNAPFDIPPIDIAEPTDAETHYQVQRFLHLDSFLLDHNRLAEWLNILAPDLRYFVPVRQTLDRANKDNEFSTTIGHMDDDFDSIAMRVHRLVNTKTAWSEDPASRVRRFVTNVAVWKTDVEGEFNVNSYLLMTRNRFYEENYQLLSAERHDRVRRKGESFELVRREVRMDQAVLGMPNLAIFL